MPYEDSESHYPFEHSFIIPPPTRSMQPILCKIPPTACMSLSRPCNSLKSGTFDNVPNTRLAALAPNTPSPATVDEFEGPICLMRWEKSVLRRRAKSMKEARESCLTARMSEPETIVRGSTWFDATCDVSDEGCFIVLWRRQVLAASFPVRGYSTKQRISP
jgi:hypothetical protein